MTATTSTRAMLASQKEQQIAEQKAREQLEASGVIAGIPADAGRM